MSESLDEIRTLEHLRSYIHQTLCEKENLLADQFAMTEMPLFRRGGIAGFNSPSRGRGACGWGRFGPRTITWFISTMPKASATPKSASATACFPKTTTARLPDGWERAQFCTFSDENPKHEIRNTKQIQNLKFNRSKPRRFLRSERPPRSKVWDLSILVIRICFGFRDSDFGF